VARRMEVKGSAGGVRVIDDYGHHPTEIAATIGALAGVAAGRLIVVFQPHRYSRTKALAADFGPAFALADHVAVTSIYSANEPPIEGVTAALVADAVRKCGGPSIEYVPSRANLVPHLVSVVREGDTVLTLGAGDIGTLGDELLARL